MSEPPANLNADVHRAPDISVLMTVYNTDAFLAEAIESVLMQQTRRSWELLLVDDGSTDTSLSIAQAFALRHPGQIRVLQHRPPRNRGISTSRNCALSHARGRLIAFLDSDDVWLPHHCDVLADVLDTHPQVALVYGSAERWVDFDLPFSEPASRASGWGRNYLPPLVPHGERAGVLAPGALLRWFCADESLVPCICSVMVRTEAARNVGGFCSAFRGLYDDQAFHARISSRFPVYALDTCVARYRQHEHSCCALARQQEVLRAREQQRFNTLIERELSFNS